MDNFLTQLPLFMLVFIRMGAFMAFVPFFDNANFVSLVKEGFAFMVALLLFPGINTASWVIPQHSLSYVMLMLQEALVGVLIGFIFQVILSCLQLAGHIVGYQMAFTMASVVDSTFGESSDVLSVLVVLVGTMIALALGADHYMLYAFNRSFEIIPPGTFLVSNAFLKDVVILLTKAFDLGVRLAAPAMILLLAIDLILGIIGKAAAKIQIFFVGLPLKIGVGLFCLTLMMSFIVSIWGKEVAKLPDYFIHFFKLVHI